MKVFNDFCKTVEENKDTDVSGDFSLLDELLRSAPLFNMLDVKEEIIDDVNNDYVNSIVEESDMMFLPYDNISMVCRCVGIDVCYFFENICTIHCFTNHNKTNRYFKVLLGEGGVEIEHVFVDEELMDGEDLSEEAKEGAKTLGAMALRFLVLINKPTEFIFIDSPISKPRKNKKIPRTNQRPIYTVLSPDKIRTVYGLGGGGGSCKSPHSRRAHIRTLHAERYGVNKGKKIKIKSTWVGDSERVVGNHKYRVVLDR